MKKKRKSNKRHHSRSSTSSRRRRTDTSSSDDDSLTANFKDTKNDQLEPIAAFINDRAEMVNQMFAILHRGRQLKAILPEILKSLPLEELKRMCVEQLEGMSKKRIQYILSGEEMLSSSGTDESSIDDDENVDTVMAQTGKQEGNNDYQQPDSTSVEPDQPNLIVIQNDTIEAEGDDVSERSEALALEEPLVDIVLEEPSPQPSPSATGQCESNEITSELVTSGDREPGEHADLEQQEQHDNAGDENIPGVNDEVDLAEEQSRSSEGPCSPSGETDLEEGEIADEPMKQKGMMRSSEMETDGEQAEEFGVPGGELTDCSIGECVVESTGPDQESIGIDHMRASVEDDEPGKFGTDKNNQEPSEQHKHDDNSETMNLQSENVDDDEELMAEVQAQDEMLFSDGTSEMGNRQVQSDDAGNCGNIEFLDEPIRRPDETATADGENVHNFTWQQRATMKPKGLEDGGEVNVERVENEEIEPYDEDWSQDAISSSTDDLVPPGFEPPTKVKRTAESADPTSSTGCCDQTAACSTTKRKTTSILPIRTLYYQLKQHRLATLKKENKPKIYGPQLFKTCRIEPKPAGPELPPTSTMTDDAGITNQKNIKLTEKKKKKSTSSEILTPEFLAELEKKRLEHEEDMKMKEEMLEKLKLERQKLTMREREVEEELKKKLELGLFESTEKEVRKKRRSKDETKPKKQKTVSQGQGPNLKVTVSTDGQPRRKAATTPPAVDDGLERRAELFELELRAKAIRSLMKVQNDKGE